MSNSVPVRGEAQLQTMDIGGLMDSTEYGKMKVEAQVKITNFKQRCYYASCDKCPSATTAEIGWEFEWSRCQELRVSIPRAMVAVLMYDKDAEVDAVVFGPIAERLLRKPAIDCMHYALEGQDGLLHNVNDHLEGENYVFVVRKKRIVRKKLLCAKINDRTKMEKHQRIE